MNYYNPITNNSNMKRFFQSIFHYILFLFIVHRIFIKIFSPFINLTNYQSNTTKIQRIESFALNCMIKITSLLYSSIPLSPRWTLETILSNLYPFIDSEINRTEMINEFQSQHVYYFVFIMIIVV